ncbi:MAG: hypothetical protein BroJett025_02780 [Patescibacteria group bacterium]|nr:MAG: hypothetical protein BroJett025_02780 [Patescibacteria group bacterium]
MLTETDRTNIALLNNELTILSRARNNVEELLKKKLSKELYNEICPEVTGILMYAQNSLHQRIERIKVSNRVQERHEPAKRFRFD